MKVREFWPKIITTKQLDSLGALVRHSQAQKCLQIYPKLLLNSYEIFKISYLADFSTDLLTNSRVKNGNSVTTLWLTCFDD